MTLLRRLEIPLALGPLGLTMLTMAMKTVGLSYLPSLAMVFAQGKNSQYPVRKVNPKLWNAIYFLMYGVLGTIAQLNGLIISLDVSNREERVNETTRNRARIFGFFHVVIGLHHILYAAGISGRLNLKRYKIPPSVQIVGGLPVVWTILHGLRLLFVKMGDDFDKVVVRHKTVCDAVSLLTFAELIVFVPANMMKYKSFELERNTWMATLIAPVLVLCYDVVAK